MDYLALMACYAAGVIALIFASRHPNAGFLMHLFAVLAGLFLAAGFVILGLQTHALSPVRWTGEAGTGPLTLLVLLLSLCSPFIVGWEREYDNEPD